MTPDFCLVCILLIPLAATGLALIHQGLGRSRSAAHAMLATLCSLAIAAIVFVLIGSSWMGFPAGLAHTLHLAGKSIDWLGAEPLFATGLTFTLTHGPYPAFVLAFGIFAAGLATLIPISAGTDRWRLAAICAASALFVAIIFPLFAHWVWSNGWLAQLSPLFGLPAFTDLGGAAVLNVLGGLAALSVAWILGPRQGKVVRRGQPPIRGIMNIIDRKRRLHCVILRLRRIVIEKQREMVRQFRMFLQDPEQGGDGLTMRELAPEENDDG